MCFVHIATAALLSAGALSAAAKGFGLKIQRAGRQNG